jgi:hypothetical protein
MFLVLLSAQVAAQALARIIGFVTTRRQQPSASVGLRGIVSAS